MQLLFATTAAMATLASSAQALAIKADPTLAPGTPGTVTHGLLTVYTSDVPADADPWWPWEDTEDFFRYSGLSKVGASPSQYQCVMSV
jgi:hypothetical protein